jgi:uncharacterized phiE125 gp8 family phage protein
MSLRRVAEATVKPVSLAEVQQHLRMAVTTISTATATALSDADQDLLRKIKTAIEVAEDGKLHRSIMQQKWRLTLDGFPSDTAVIQLKRPPLLSAEATAVVITYTDTSGASKTLASTAYTVDRESFIPAVKPSGANVWPDTSTDSQSVTIEFLSGASAASLVAERVKSWIKARVGTMVMVRESILVSYSGSLDVRNVNRDYVDGLLDGCDPVIEV